MFFSNDFECSNAVRFSIDYFLNVNFSGKSQRENRENLVPSVLFYVLIKQIKVTPTFSTFGLKSIQSSFDS